jgi:UDPglucose 6-dehydrogenase
MTKNLSIVGIGKLGLCFSLLLEKNGHNIIGVDIDQNYVNLINTKNLKSDEPLVENFLKNSKNFKATTRLDEAIKHSNIIFIIVATPSLDTGEYDHTQVINVINEIKNFGLQKEKKHIVICCTVMPGFSDYVKNILSPLNFDVSYNPEFIAQGSILHDQENPDIVLIGEPEINSKIGDDLEKIYKNHTKNNPKICRMNLVEAEITKISLNCFLTTKIAYANMIGDIVANAGGNPDIVLSAIGNDSRVGQKYLKYGFGYGGPCLPRDNRALAIYAKKNNMSSKISEATDLSNLDHLNFLVEKYSANNEIILDTITYKPESLMLTESQKLQFAIRLAQAGVCVKIKERKSVIDILKKQYENLFEFEVKND